MPYKCLDSKESTRLRLSKAVAEHCNFKYNAKQFKYGGFFSIVELETILSKLEAAKRVEAGQKA